MLNEIQYEESLQIDNIVLVYFDKMKNIYLGHAYYYGGKSTEYMLFLYKDFVPAGMSLLDGWNYLDENSINTVIVGEESSKIAIEDFLYSRKLEKDVAQVHYTKVNDYDEMNEHFKTLQLQEGCVVGYIVGRN